MKKITIHILIALIVSCFSISNSIAQDTKTAAVKKEKIYHPKADAKQDIQTLLEKANAENKHLILQIGGNWCKWCIKFHDFVQQDTSIHTIIENNYLIYHLNYSKENKNLDLLEKYEFPQRLGFPVFVVLDKNGRRLHTQDSWMLEDHANKAGGYNKKMVEHFFKSWTPKALDPESYRK